jgi:hypothetical protein
MTSPVTCDGRVKPGMPGAALTWPSALASRKASTLTNVAFFLRALATST